MHPRPFILAALALVLTAAVGLGSASARQRTTTYAGTVSSGGTLRFVVSSDGRAITRLVFTKVQTACSKMSSTTTGKIPINGRSFSYSAGSITFKGTFNATKTRASGTFTFKDLAMPGCSGPPVRWAATRR
ncbi:MAG: hypothetical protein ACXVY3_09630 [Gaiellaceae bacterium]